jgi:glutamine phosphoribosylpyrophosphate amidotransferase
VHAAEGARALLRRVAWTALSCDSNALAKPACVAAHRPLVIGKRSSPQGDEWCIASEDCAFGPIGFERVRDVLPGEMVIITEEGKLMSRQCAQVRAGLAALEQAAVTLLRRRGMPARAKVPRG